MKNILIALVLLASVAAVAQDKPVTTFKSADDGFQISVPAANFKQVTTKTGTTADGFPFTVRAYAGDNPQGDYLVVVTTYDREITNGRFLALADAQKGDIYLRRNDLDFDGQPGVLRMVRSPEGKMANWMTFKGKRFYQIMFGSALEAGQIDFEEVNAFCNSFKFIN